MKKFVLLAMFFLLLTGCTEKRPEGLPKLYPLTITLTQQGKPLPGAAITLFPEGANIKWACGGTTDEQGNASVRTHGIYNGAPEGTLKMAVFCNFSDAADQLKTLNPESPEYAQLLKAHPWYNVVPKSYREQETTPLQIVVKPETNSVTIDIPEKVHEKIIDF